jgi:hypothetical protein
MGLFVVISDEVRNYAILNQNEITINSYNDKWCVSGQIILWNSKEEYDSVLNINTAGASQPYSHLYTISITKEYDTLPSKSVIVSDLYELYKTFINFTTEDEI